MMYSQIECLEDLTCEGEPCCQGERDINNNCECPPPVVADWNAAFDELNAATTWASVLAYCRNPDGSAAEAWTTKVFDTWAQNKADTCQHLPEVCESGEACRNDIFDGAKAAIVADMTGVFDRICDKITDSWIEGKRILTEGFEEEFVCEPGCYCEEIENTYIDHVRLEREIEREIDDIQNEIKNLIQKQNEVLENCPDYAETRYVVDEQYLN